MSGLVRNSTFLLHGLYLEQRNTYCTPSGVYLTREASETASVIGILTGHAMKMSDEQLQVAQPVTDKRWRVESSIWYG